MRPAKLKVTDGTVILRRDNDNVFAHRGEGRSAVVLEIESWTAVEFDGPTEIRSEEPVRVPTSTMVMMRLSQARKLRAELDRLLEAVPDA